MVRIREARIDELPLLRDIEQAAGKPFHSIGMPEIAADEPPSIETLARYQRAGRAWVAAGPIYPAGSSGTTEATGTRAPVDRPVAYLIADPVDGCVHIEQVSVHPDAAHRRIGRSLIEHVAAWARAAGTPALTLTAFANVPWNAPYYARCGFRPLAESELSPGLRELRRHEAERGLDRWPRVCMRRDL